MDRVIRSRTNALFGARSFFSVLVVFGMLLGLGSGCSINSAKNRYVLAEKLWSDGRYAAAVVEFDKVYAKDTKGKLGLQALFRAATTEMLYLAQYEDSIRKFKAYEEGAGQNEQSWEAERDIGEILYSKTEQYDQAILHYQNMIRRRPMSPENPELLYRIGRSEFFLWRFDEALDTYRELIKKNHDSPWAEKALFEIGVTYFTRGEQRAGSESYQDASDAYQRFITQYPKSELVPQAKFGIASSLEEMDQLDAAYHLYQDLLTSYPSPSVIQIKLARIHQRQSQRSRK